MCGTKFIPKGFLFLWMLCFTDCCCISAGIKQNENEKHVLGSNDVEQCRTCRRDSPFCPPPYCSLHTSMQPSPPSICEADFYNNAFFSCTESTTNTPKEDMAVLTALYSNSIRHIFDSLICVDWSVWTVTKLWDLEKELKNIGSGKRKEVKLYKKWIHTNETGLKALRMMRKLPPYSSSWKISSLWDFQEFEAEIHKRACARKHTHIYTHIYLWTIMMIFNSDEGRKLFGIQGNIVSKWNWLRNL